VTVNGADARSMFLLTDTLHVVDHRDYPKKMGAAWNFINKSWNASRFVIMNLPEDAKPAHMPDTSKFDLADSWIFDRLNHTVSEVTRLFDEYQFGEAGRELYNFIWNDFCYWNIEIYKYALKVDY